MTRVEWRNRYLTKVLVLLPSAFMLRGDWLVAGALGVMLLVAYHRATNFKKYRAKTERLSKFAVRTNVVGLLLGLLVSIDPAWRAGAVFAFAVVCFPMLFWLDAGIDGKADSLHGKRETEESGTKSA